MTTSMANDNDSNLPCLAEELAERPSSSSKLNFSRPRPLAQGKVYHDRHDSATLITGAPDERTRALLTHLPPLRPPPLLSRDSDYTTSAASEFSWDPESGELRSRTSDVDYSGRPSMVSELAVPTDIAYGQAATRPRHVLQKRSRSTTTASSESSLNSRSLLRPQHQPTPPSRSSSKTPASVRHFVAELPGDSPTAQARTQSLVSSPSPAQAGTSGGFLRSPSAAQPTVQQRPPSSASTAESERSHHTVSDAEAEAAAEAPRWRGSDFDTSGLSVKKVQKLRKKGVNPALYAEMKAARKGKNRWVGSLTGNSFLG